MPYILGVLSLIRNPFHFSNFIFAQERQVGTIRVLLAISVLITHSEPILGKRLLTGDSAITCFFVISGYLMALILSEKYTSKKAFYLNRFLRIYPPYYVAFFVSLLIYYIFSPSNHNPISTAIEAINKESYIFLAWSLLSNLTLIGIDLTRYIQLDTVDFLIRVPNFLFGGGGGGHNLLAIPQAWTLALELQFYLLAPFIIRLKTIKLILLATLFTIIRIYVYRELRQNGYNIDDGAFFPLQFHYFLYGVIGYRFYRLLVAISVTEKIKQNLACVIWLFAIVMVLFGLDYLQGRERWEYDFFYMVFAFTVPFQFYASNKIRFDSYIGEYSYPVYLFHYGIMLALYKYELGNLWGESVLALTLFVSALYIHFLDPLVQRRRRRIAVANSI